MTPHGRPKLLGSMWPRRRYADRGGFHASRPWNSLLKVLVAALLLKVTAGIVASYRNYWPPRFASGFLHGREAYFWHGYHWAFYTHLITGPLALLFGLILMSDWWRRTWPRGHRFVGRAQVVTVLLGLVPSGMAMARFAESGRVAGWGFGVLAAVTAISILLGWRAARYRQWEAHRQWMTRCFLMLVSAVVLRLLGGLFTMAEVRGIWTYPFAAWASWLGPLLAFECALWYHGASRAHRHQRDSAPHDYSLT